jgi:hypothetical protein
MGDRLGYTSLFVGLALAVGAAFYRIAASNPGGPPPGATEDQQAVRIATVLMISGGLIATSGAVVGWLLSRRNRLRNQQKADGADKEQTGTFL